MRIEEISALNTECLNRLFNDEIIALVVRNYFDPSLCKKIGDEIAQNDSLEKYYYEVSDKGERKSLFLGVSRLGVSFSTTFGRDRMGTETKRYYEVALNNIGRVRSFFSPYLSPIDKLRLELDEYYSNGSKLGTFEKKKMFTGIARVTHKDMDFQEKMPHVDSLPSEYNLERQYSANIYLTVPDSGGEIVIYPLAPLSASEVDDFEINEELWRSKLPEGVSIKPNAGDLIIINTRRPHAVKKFSEKNRVSLQTFIGVNKGEPLHLWC